MTKDNLSCCIICATEFKNKPNNSNKFCSINCYRVSQRRGDYKRGREKTTEKNPCSYCGKDVYGQTKTCQRTGKKHKNYFCNRDCYNNYRTEQRPFCKNCDQRVPAGMPKAKFCSWDCRVEYKKPKPKNCVNCGCSFSAVKPIKRKTGIKLVAVTDAKTCSHKCNIEWRSNNQDRKDKISKAFKGERHPNWQGGISHLSNSSYRGRDWKQIAEKARKRDKYCCLRCGMTQEDNGRKLDVHHIIPYHNFNNSQKANKMKNLRTLCQRCHRIEEWQVEGGKQMILPFHKR